MAVGGRGTAALLAIGGLMAVAGCASSERAAPQRSADVRPSPQVVSGGGPIPKGGGVYKIGSPYQIAGRWYVPRDEPGYDQAGVASWYGSDFHGRRTANGEVFDMNALTAAHPTLPLPSLATVTNLDTGRTILVRINDRGPYAKDRLIDLSRRSARELGFEHMGTARVRVRYAGPAPLDGNDHAERRYLAGRPVNPEQHAARPAFRPSPEITASISNGWSVSSYRSGYLPR
ncbi:MAG: septal ring lytic transglycosylase RlpA family protein [Pseudomonadota bacterium]